MAADVAEPERVRPPEQRRLRAGHVGDDRARRQQRCPTRPPARPWPRGRPEPVPRARPGPRREAPRPVSPRPARSSRPPMPGTGPHPTVTRPPSSSRPRPGSPARPARSNRRSARSRGMRCAYPRVSQSPPRPCAGAPQRGAAPPLASLAFAPLSVVGRRARVIGRVGPAQLLPAVERPPLVAQVGAAARTATLLGEQRLDRSDGVELPAARPAGELGHRAGPLRPAAARPGRPRPARAGTRSPPGCRSGSARTTTGRSARGRTGRTG